MTSAAIIWGLLVLGYGTSTVPLFRQGFRRLPRPVVAPGKRVVYHPSLSRARRARRSAA
jgi:hypothetical protein